MIENTNPTRRTQGPGSVIDRRGSLLGPLDDRLRPVTSAEPAPTVPPRATPHQAAGPSNPFRHPTLGSDPTPTPDPPSSSGRRVGVVVGVVVAALALGGLAGLVTLRDDDAPAEPTQALPAEAVPPVAAQPNGPEPSGQTLSSPTVEPVAVVAEKLGPSVVQVETNLGQGSGVVFRDGLALTNHHVIANTSEVQLRLADGSVIAAELVGSDARIDIAVLRFDADVPVAELALDGTLDVGHLVVAIGSPFQLDQTVTSGVVSALDRPVPNDVGGANPMIQTDTAINPGNSGGALADRRGRVVGINTSGRTDGNSNSNIGIGFAIPIDVAVATADRLLAGGSMAPGVLGVSPDPASSATEAGVVLGEVTEGSPAAQAGLEAGDRVVSVDGRAVRSAEGLAAVIQSHFAGDELTFVVVRNGLERTLAVTLS